MCSSSPAHLRIWPVQSLTACCAGYVDHIPFMLVDYYRGLLLRSVNSKSASFLLRRLPTFSLT